MYLLDLLLQYKYFAMFGALFLCGIGLPVPEEITLLTSGLAVGWKNAHWLLAGLSCVAGILAGDAVIFGLGRYYGRVFMTSRATRWIFTRKRQAKVRKLFSEHHSKTVFIARFFTGLRIVVYAYAGQHGMSWSRFLLLDCLASLGYTAIFIGGGWFLAANFDHDEAARLAERVFEAIRAGQHWLLVGGILLAAFLALWWWRRNSCRRREAAVVEAGDHTGSAPCPSPRAAKPVEVGKRRGPGA
jgi:membrane protein DedA with SNARE-associated domain